MKSFLVSRASPYRTDRKFNRMRSSMALGWDIKARIARPFFGHRSPSTVKSLLANQFLFSLAQPHGHTRSHRGLPAHTASVFSTIETSSENSFFYSIAIPCCIIKAHCISARNSFKVFFTNIFLTHFKLLIFCLLFAMKYHGAIG